MTHIQRSSNKYNYQNNSRNKNKTLRALGAALTQSVSQLGPQGQRGSVPSSAACRLHSACRTPLPLGALPGAALPAAILCRPVALITLLGFGVRVMDAPVSALHRISLSFTRLNGHRPGWPSLLLGWWCLTCAHGSCRAFTLFWAFELLSFCSV